MKYMAPHVLPIFEHQEAFFLVAVNTVTSFFFQTFALYINSSADLGYIRSGSPHIVRVLRPQGTIVLKNRTNPGLIEIYNIPILKIFFFCSFS